MKLTSKIFLNVLLISIVISVGAMILDTIIFSYGSTVTNISAEDWSKIDTMPYKTALNYIESHSKKLSGIAILKNYFSSLYMLTSFLKSTLRFFIPIFIASFLVITLQRRNIS